MYIVLYNHDNLSYVNMTLDEVILFVKLTKYLGFKRYQIMWEYDYCWESKADTFWIRILIDYSEVDALESVDIVD